MRENPMPYQISNRINTLPPRRIIRNTDNSKLVLQCEFAITAGKEKEYLIKTPGFNSCLVLTLYSSEKKVGGMAHFDVETEVPRSLREVVLPEFRKRDCRGLKACLVGGVEGHSGDLIRAVRDSLKGSQIGIAGMDIFDSFGYPGLILSARTGRLFDPDTTDIKSDAETLFRFESALRYLVDTPAPRLIRLVG